MASKAEIGGVGEQVAVHHLRQAGLVVLDRNWRCRGRGLRGELDVVARDGDTLVFCEVKTRTQARFGSPADAVTPAKARRIRALATAWVQESGLRAREVRFDVVAVLCSAGPLAAGSATVEHLRGAF
jgi:putative endonuclease